MDEPFSALDPLIRRQAFTADCGRTAGNRDNPPEMQ